MRLLVLGALSVIPFALAQQATFQESRIESGIKAMQRSTILLQDASSSPEAKPPKLEITYTADKIERNGSTVKLRGNVKILKADAFLLFAEAAEYHEFTGSITTDGPAQVLPILAPSSKQ